MAVADNQCDSPPLLFAGACCVWAVVPGLVAICSFSPSLSPLCPSCFLCFLPSISSLFLSISTSPSLCPIWNFCSDITRAIILCHHLAAVVPGALGPAQQEEEVGAPHSSMVGTEGEITGSLGGNGLEVCVSETTPARQALFPKLQVQGLGGCTDSVLR